MIRSCSRLRDELRALNRAVGVCSPFGPRITSAVDQIQVGHPWHARQSCSCLGNLALDLTVTAASTVRAKRVLALSTGFLVMCPALIRSDADDRGQFVGSLVNVWSTRERRVDGNGIRWMTTKDVEFWKKTAPVQSLVP